ncbi:MAG: hypothetical protein FWC32_09485 [Firmicutes bacterium]|nr:hypothetical protein [Bacillota bacterium]
MKYEGDMKNVQALLDVTDRNPTMVSLQNETNEKVDNVQTTADNIENKVSDVNAKVVEIVNVQQQIIDKLSDTNKNWSSKEDAAKEKQQTKASIENTTNVSGNQQNIQNIHNYYGPHHLMVREVMVNTAKTDAETKIYDLTNAENFAEFGEQYKAGELFAFAIILSVFDYVELDDLGNLKASLMREMPKITDEKGKEIAINQDPYFSTNRLIKTINGKFYENDLGEKCVGLGEGREKALKNLWEQFPSLRNCISKWLLSISDTYENLTNFEAYQISAAFVNIIKMDFTSGERHIFGRINERNAWLLGVIVLKLYEDTSYSDRILSIVKVWISSKEWHWKPAYYFYAYVELRNEDDLHEFEFKKVLGNRVSRLLTRGGDIFSILDILYISQFLIYSERARTLVASIMNSLEKSHTKYQAKMFWAEIYFILLKECYMDVSDKYPLLPLVACDKRDQLLNILPLASKSLERYDIKRPLFILLGAYLTEVSDYTITEDDVKRITAFFVMLVNKNKQHACDILTMLKNCKCRLADDVINSIKIKLHPIGIT